MGKLWGREVSISGEAVREEVSVGGEAVEGGTAQRKLLTSLLSQY